MSLAATALAAPEEITLRAARLEDGHALEALQRAAVLELCARDYSRAELEAFLGSLGTLDLALVRDGTYRVADLGGRLVGCGGWSFRDRGIGGGRSAARTLVPARDAAWMRGFFVHPDFERRGIAGLLLRAAERDARLAGFRRAQLLATVTGEPVYRRHGYRLTHRLRVPCPGNLSLPAAHMQKRLHSGDGLKS